MEYDVIDSISGDTLEPGDFLLIGKNVVELLDLVDEDVIEYHILNHSNGDDYNVTFDPNSYYSLLGG